MHREFKKLLEKATGTSEFIIAINVDIRGFSSFSKTVESPEAVMFVKRVYMKLLKDYFPDASFFKSTGDGLLILIHYTEENLGRIATSTVQTCLRLLGDFGSFCSSDPMINFEVPKKVGIGLSRGCACRLISDDRILDYSGRCLNLASRLMDLARPAGIVLDANFGMELLPPNLIEKFTKESVYISGVAEDETTDIYYTKDYTAISAVNKIPIKKVRWIKVKDKIKLKRLKKHGSHFAYKLPNEPINQNRIKVTITHPAISKGKIVKGIMHYFSFPNVVYFIDAGIPKVMFELDALLKVLQEYGVKDDWNIHVEIAYPEK